MSRYRFSMVIGNVIMGFGRVIRPIVPRKIAKGIDDRFFGAVFQVTRVTNDNYGNGTQESAAQLDENG